jgi:hypothetical protein
MGGSGVSGKQPGSSQDSFQYKGTPEYTPLSQALGIDNSFIDQFATSGLGDASKLKNAYLRKFTGMDNGTYYGYVDANTGEDVSKLVEAYRSFATNTQNANVKHEEYVKLKKDRPGRDATLLMPDTNPDPSNPALLLGE